MKTLPAEALARDTWGTAPVIGDLDELFSSHGLQRLFERRPRVRPGRRRFSHHYYEAYSPKLDRRVGLYGTLAYDHWVSIEADSTVSWFTERPARLVLQKGDHESGHVFHFVLKRHGAIECHRLLDEQKAVASDWCRINTEREWCTSVGVHYRLITKAALEQDGILIENWKEMLPYIEQLPHPLDERVLGYVSAVGELTLAELDMLLADFDATEARGIVYGLLHQGRLEARDLTEMPLSADMTVRISHD